MEEGHNTQEESAGRQWKSLHLYLDRGDGEDVHTGDVDMGPRLYGQHEPGWEI